jgi:hypothetical protein
MLHRFLSHRRWHIPTERDLGKERRFSDPATCVGGNELLLSLPDVSSAIEESRCQAGWHFWQGCLLEQRAPARDSRITVDEKADQIIRLLDRAFHTLAANAMKFCKHMLTAPAQVRVR